jgi:hypothetical protein
MELSAKELQPVLNEMLIHATTRIPDDILSGIKEAHAHETKDLAKKQLEAYRHTTKEARKLGMSDDEIVDYLKLTWLDEEEVRRLARHLGVRVSRKHGLGR